MFAIVRHGRVTRLLAPGEPFELDGVRYPPGWLGAVGEAERGALGILSVDSAPPPLSGEDDAFWFLPPSPLPPPEVREGRVVVPPSPLPVPRLMDDLRPACVARVRAEAHARLAPTDWLVVRAAEGGKPVPDTVRALRQRVRDESARLERLIARARDAAALMATLRGAAWPGAGEV